MNEPTLASLRKRILMLYFATGLNVVMGFFVITAGSGSGAAPGQIWLIALVFLAFAGVNYYLARVLRKRFEELTRQSR